MAKSLSWAFGAALLLLRLLSTFSMPQNGAEVIGLAVMTMAGSAIDAIQKGGAIRKSNSFDAHLFKMDTTMEAAIGESAIKKRADSSEETRRRKRRTRQVTNSMQPITAVDSAVMWQDEGMLPVGSSSQQRIHRDKRSPCHTVGQPQPQPPPVDTEVVDEAARKRRRAAAQRKRAISRRTKKTAKRSKKLIEEHARRRRQTEVNELLEDNKSAGNSGGGVGQKIGEHAKTFAEGMRDLFQKFAKGMREAWDGIRNFITGGGAVQPAQTST